MKKGLIIVLGVLLGIILLDTMQARIFNNSPLISIRKEYKDGYVPYMNKGLLVNYYYCTNKEERTVFKWTKFNCPLDDSNKDNDYNNDEHSFYGKVVETYPSYIIVKPNEDEEEIKSSDKFFIDLKDDDTIYKVGARIKITYIGMINESYPAQIGTTKIELLKPNYSKTVGNVILEMNIPDDWQYEELSQDESDAFYKYALKLYKSEDSKNAILYFDNNPFYFCGTLLTIENISLDNGEQAIVGYYGAAEWDFIHFETNSNITFRNYGLEGNEAKEVLDFVKTINIK